MWFGVQKEFVLATNRSEDEKLLESQLLARRADYVLGLARIITIAAWAAIILSLITWAVASQYKQLLWSSSLLFLVAISMGIYPYFYRRGMSALGAKIALACGFIALAGCYILLPELNLTIVIGYVLFFILSDMFLGPVDSRWIKIVGLVLLLGGVVMPSLPPNLRINIEGLFPPLDTTIIAIFAPIFVLLTSIIAIFVIDRIVGEQENFFRQSKRSNWEIDRRAEAERREREHLEVSVQMYAAHMAQVAQGNLAVRLEMAETDRSNNDPLINLGDRLNEMTVSLAKMISQLRATADSLSTAAAEILAAATEQTNSASEHLAVIAQTTSSVKQVESIVKQSIARAQEVADNAQHTVQISKGGQQAVQNTISSMNHIKTRVEGVAKTILSLSEQTQHIGEIIATVSDISSQSNMLALNASVEAARAGEHGKGFAVVAVEVRHLAEQSKQATLQIRSILQEIQKATSTTVVATEESTKGVDAGLKLSAQTQQSIEQLSDAIEKSAQAAIHMSAGGQQQSTGIEQISTAIQNINQVTIQSLTNTRLTEKAAQDLNQLASALMETVERYRLK
jgi:methyl-accepting chemotaxis protein